MKVGKKGTSWREQSNPMVSSTELAMTKPASAVLDVGEPGEPTPSPDTHETATGTCCLVRLARRAGALLFRVVWLLVLRWAAVALLLVVGWLDGLLGIGRNAFRDLLELPARHACRCDVLSLALHLAVQVPLSAVLTLLRALVYSLLPPVFALVGAWDEALEIAVWLRLGLATALLARCPVWGDANAKLHTFASKGATGTVRALLGERNQTAGRRGAAARRGRRLLADIDLKMGGAAPIDRLTADIVRLRLATHASVDAVNVDGASALHHCAKLGLARTAHALLQAGADPNMADEEGRTPLHYAVRSASSNAATRRLLRDAPGADLCLTDVHGRTAMMEVHAGCCCCCGGGGGGGGGGSTRLLMDPTPGWAAVEEALARVPEVVAAAAAAAAAGASGSAGAAPPPTVAAAQAAGAPPRLHPVLALLPHPPDVRRLRLRDMLRGGDRVPPAEQSRRQALVFARLIAPLVHKARAAPLAADEKTLLIHACEATDGAARASTREQFGALVGGTMALFERDLGAEYARLGGVAANVAGAALLALPAVELLGGIHNAELSQAAPAAMGLPPWLESAADWLCDEGGAPSYHPRHAVGHRKARGAPGGPSPAPSLKKAYHALKASGAMGGYHEFCATMQSGRHALLAATAPEHFALRSARACDKLRGAAAAVCGGGGCCAVAERWQFWLHVAALYTVGRNGQCNDEFQDRVRALAEGFGATAAKYKEAPLKKYERIVVKARQYHAAGRLARTPLHAAEAVGRVIDIQRCSIEVLDAATAMAVIAELKGATLAAHGMRPLRCKSGFAAAAETAGGYRDVKLNMLFQSAHDPQRRAVVEVQVILKSYLLVKKRMHAIYRLDWGDFD
jgi:hypothetical protein